MAGSKVIKTPVATTQYCYLQGEGYRFNDADEPVFKTNLIFEGADADTVQAVIDEALETMVEGSPTNDSMEYPIYTREGSKLTLKVKVKRFGKKKDGTKFERTVPVINIADNSAVTETVGSGSIVEAALELRGWKFGNKTGLSVYPAAIAVHEAKQGGSSARRTLEEWGDFFGEGAAAAPATAGAPVAEDDI